MRQGASADAFQRVTALDAESQRRDVGSRSTVMHGRIAVGVSAFIVTALGARATASPVHADRNGIAIINDGQGHGSA